MALLAQEKQPIQDCVALNECFEKCADNDEACLDKCDTLYTCPEDPEDQNTQDIQDDPYHQEDQEDQENKEDSTQS